MATEAEWIGLLGIVENVLQAGANRSRQWVYNVDRQQQADVLEAMADEARRLKAGMEEGEGWPL